MWTFDPAAQAGGPTMCTITTTQLLLLLCDLKWYVTRFLRGGHVEILSDLDGGSVWWPRGDKMGFYGVAT